MNESRLQEIYTSIFTTMRRYGLLTLPLPLHDACRALGVDLVSLSDICVKTGLSAQQVFEVWGNEDGVVMAHGGAVKIAYNDLAPRERSRFTVCEEIGHYLLGHVWDPRFNAFDQRYDDPLYLQYEEEARTAAGLLLCQPQFFYRAGARYTRPRALAYLCDVSLPCAAARSDILRRCRASIERNAAYRMLPQPKLCRSVLRAEIVSREPEKRVHLDPRHASYSPSAIIIDGPGRA